MSSERSWEHRSSPLRRTRWSLRSGLTLRATFSAPTGRTTLSTRALRTGITDGPLITLGTRLSRNGRQS